MNALVATVGGSVVLIIGLAAGSTAASGSSSGTETLTGVVSGAAAAKLLNANGNPPLKFTSLVFSGPVNTSLSNVTLGGGKAKTATHAFVTPAGNFTVTRTVTSKGQPQPTVTGQTGNTCHFTANFGGGSYNAGRVQEHREVRRCDRQRHLRHHGPSFSRPASGQDDMQRQQHWQRDGTGASITFKASGPLTLKR